MPYQITLVAYTAGWSLVRRLPAAAAYRAFRGVADAAWHARSRGVQRLEANLARVVGTSVQDPRVRSLSRAGMRSYLRYWCDTFRLPDWDRDRLVSSVTTENDHLLFGNLDAGRGVIAALPHMGNWDHAGAWATAMGAPVTTVAERLQPEDLYKQFLAYRESLGMEILPLTGGGTDVFRTLLRRARTPTLVPLLADRDLTARGIRVEFFGATASMPTGPAALALASGAALIPVTIMYEGEEPRHRINIRFHDEVLPPSGGTSREKIEMMMQHVADVFAKAIAQQPEDWHMLQRVWIE